MNLIFSRPSSLVGLDIRADGIFLLELSKARNHFTVEHASMTHLSINLPKDSKYWQELVEILTSLVQELNIVKHKAAICLSVNLVKLQHLQLDKNLSERNIESEIYARVQRGLPEIKNEDLYLDYVELPRAKKHQKNLFLAMTRQEYLTQYVNCVQAAGLQVKITDVDIYALQRALCYRVDLSWSHNNAYAIIHELNNIVLFIVFNATEIIFHQHWHIDKAEQYIEQLQKTLHLYEITFPNLQIISIIVLTTSASSLCHDEANYFNSYKLQQANPFNHMKFAAKQDEELIKNNTAAFLTACGLAMREVPQW